MCCVLLCVALVIEVEGREKVKRRETREERETTLYLLLVYGTTPT